MIKDLPASQAQVLEQNTRMYAEQLPVVSVDFDYLVTQRPRILSHTDLPAYLLRPEIHAILAATETDTQHFLLNTLWHTGARISEALALTAGAFHLDEVLPYVSIKTLKKGRRSRLRSRMVPLADPVYLNQAQRYFATHKIRQTERVWAVNRSTAQRWLATAVTNMTPKWKSAIPVSLHTFRHSFAINSLFHWIPTRVLQQWMGHSSPASTDIYTQVFAAETGYFMQRVSY